MNVQAGVDAARENTVVSSFKAGDSAAAAACLHAKLLLAVAFVLLEFLLVLLPRVFPFLAEDIVETGVVLAQVDPQLDSVSGL